MKRPTFQHRHVFIGLVVCLLISSFLPAGAARVLSALPRVVVEMVTSPFAAPLKSLGDAVRQPAPPTFALTDTNNVIELRDNIEQMYQLNHRLRLEMSSCTVSWRRSAPFLSRCVRAARHSKPAA
jgi:hypothetical protein